MPRDKWCFRDCRKFCFCSTTVLCRDMVKTSGLTSLRERGVDWWGGSRLGNVRQGYAHLSTRL